MSVCKGSLVVHRNGTPMLCTEELSGRSCAELSYERHRIFRSCGLTFQRGCPECDEREMGGPDPVPCAKPMVAGV
jgi:hypothetical protein